MGLKYVKPTKKYINKEIEQYLTPLALAICIMDDGGWAKPGVRIATNSFTKQEVEFLVYILNKILLRFSINIDINILTLVTLRK